MGFSIGLHHDLAASIPWDEWPKKYTESMSKWKPQSFYKSTSEEIWHPFYYILFVRSKVNNSIPHFKGESYTKEWVPGERDNLEAACHSLPSGTQWSMSFPHVKYAYPLPRSLNVLFHCSISSKSRISPSKSGSGKIKPLRFTFIFCCSKGGDFFKNSLFVFGCTESCYCVQAFSSCGKQGLLVIVVHWVLIVVVFLVVEHGL